MSRHISNHRTTLLAVASLLGLGVTAVAQPFPSPSLGEPGPVLGAPGGFVQAQPVPALEPIPAQGAPVLAAPQYSAPPVAMPAGEPWLAQPMAFVPTIPLHTRVRYKQTRNAHPCATPLIVAVKDPCCDVCNPSRCLYVKICVPPCEAPCRVTSNRDGSYVKYDWGKYAVKVHARRNGVVYVDYDD